MSPKVTASAPRFAVRRARVADAADMVRLMGEPEVFPGLLQMPLPSEGMWRARLEAFDAGDKPDLHLVAEHAGQVVGSAGLHPAPQLRRRHTAMLGISVASAWQGQGVGSLLMQALCDYADGWAQVLPSNSRSSPTTLGLWRCTSALAFGKKGAMWPTPCAMGCMPTCLPWRGCIPARRPWRGRRHERHARLWCCRGTGLWHLGPARRPRWCSCRMGINPAHPCCGWAMPMAGGQLAGLKPLCVNSGS